MSVVLFAGAEYGPNGGWNDYTGTFATVDGAKAFVDDTRTVTVHEPKQATYNARLVTSTQATFTERPRRQIGDRYNAGRPGTIIDVDDLGDTFTVDFPRHETVSYAYDWAHIVEAGTIVARFNEHDGWST